MPARGEMFMALSRQYKDDLRGLSMAVARELPGTYFSDYFSARQGTGRVR